MGLSHSFSLRGFCLSFSVSQRVKIPILSLRKSFPTHFHCHSERVSHLFSVLQRAFLLIHSLTPSEFPGYFQCHIRLSHSFSVSERVSHLLSVLQRAFLLIHSFTPSEFSRLFSVSHTSFPLIFGLTQRGFHTNFQSHLCLSYSFIFSLTECIINFPLIFILTHRGLPHWFPVS